MAVTEMLRIAIYREAETTIVAPAGEVDLFTAPLLAQTLDRVDGDVVVDLRDVEFLDARGLHAIVERDGRGGRVSVVRGRPDINRVFELTGADRTVRVLEPALA